MEEVEEVEQGCSHQEMDKQQDMALDVALEGNSEIFLLFVWSF